MIHKLDYLTFFPIKTCLHKNKGIKKNPHLYTIYPIIPINTIIWKHGLSFDSREDLVILLIQGDDTFCATKWVV